MMKFLQNNGDKLLALFTSGVSLAQQMHMLDTIPPHWSGWIIFSGAFATLAHTVLVSPTAAAPVVSLANPTQKR